MNRSGPALVERAINAASIGELLDALTVGWYRTEYGCPLCRDTGAEVIDELRWQCAGTFHPGREVYPVNPRAGARWQHGKTVRCPVGTIWQLRRLVLEDADALDRLLAQLEVAV